MKIKSKKVEDIAVEKNIPTATINKNGTIGELVSLFATHPHFNCVYVVDDENNILGYIELRELVAELYPYLQHLNNAYFTSFIERLKMTGITFLMKTDREWAACGESIVASILKMLLNDRVELPIAQENGKYEGCIKMLNLLEIIDAHLKQTECPTEG